LQLTEAGTIASAVTGFMGAGASAATIPVVRFNHPFPIFVRDDATGAVLFAAVVENPTAP
jgi:serine protease inhibitor